MPPGRILIIGGTGYLGQFCVDHFARQQGWGVGYTHHSTSPPQFTDGVQEFWADLASGKGVYETIQALQPLDVIINCAAVSQPAVCERDTTYAESVNVPTTLLDALERNKAETGNEPLLIHISTDQVYDGSKAHWTEEDECNPVNGYGRSKLQAEQVIQARWPRHYILRSSIIFGPTPPGAPVGRALFLQFVDGALAAGKPTTFFNDEWRCPIYVEDIIQVCVALAGGQQSNSAAAGGGKVYNMGGPERLSRLDMAQAVATVRGYDPELIVSAPSASIDRGVKSPADISMDSSKLWAALGITPKPFAEALKIVFGAQKDNR